MSKKYTGLIVSLHTNYIFQGIAAIILSQNMYQLMDYWNASVKDITIVMSGIGMGRLVILYFAGFFSDRVGRKKSVLLGIVCYLIFFGGILLSRNYIQGFFCALFAGFSNAFLDTGTYPTLTEAFPEDKDSSSLSVLNKAFISLGQFLLPFGMRLVLENDLFFGYIFVACLVVLAINFVVMLKMTYPEQTERTAEKAVDTESKFKKFKPSLRYEGAALVVYGFTSVSTFNIFITWAPTFASQLKIFSYENSLTLVSIYSIGSFVSVFFTSYLVKKGMPPTVLLLLFTGLSTLVLLLATAVPSSVVLIAAAVGVGVFSAGGVWQLALALLLEFFPSRKGIITSYFSIASALSVMLIPYLTGYLSEIDIRLVFVINIILTAIGFFCSLIVFLRYRQMEQEENCYVPLKLAKMKQ